VQGGATVGVTLARTRPLVAAVSGGASVTASVSRNRAITAAATGTATVTATTAGVQPITGAVQGNATVTATLGRIRALSAAVQGSATVGGSVQTGGTQTPPAYGGWFPKVPLLRRRPQPLREVIIRPDAVHATATVTATLTITRRGVPGVPPRHRLPFDREEEELAVLYALDLV
jgi:hypothetical protein